MIKHLQAPLSEEDVRALSIGDIVYITGPIYTSYNKSHLRISEQDYLPPFDTEQYNVTLYGGPTVKQVEDNEWKVQWISCTTSMRFDKWAPKFIEKTGLRAILAKGRMSRTTAEACKKFGCVHLAKMGNFSGSLGQRVKKVVGKHWLELGNPDAIWLFDVKEFGPFIVQIDANGNSLYEDVFNKVSNKKKTEVYKLLGIEGFDYSLQK